MHYKNVAPSHLPSLLLSCSYCGHRMEITAVAPALYANGAASNDLEDISHTCVQCGATLISTRRSLFSDLASDIFPFFERVHDITHFPDRRGTVG
jgi:hypothetical protein